MVFGFFTLLRFFFGVLHTVSHHDVDDDDDEEVIYIFSTLFVPAAVAVVAVLCNSELCSAFTSKTTKHNTKETNAYW